MDITPGRAPFTTDEDYTPLRLPKTNKPSSGGAIGILQMMNSDGVSSSGNSNLYVQSSNQMRTVSPSKLSPYAKEFVPRPTVMQPETNYQQYQQQQHQTRTLNGFHHVNPHQQQQAYAQNFSLETSVQNRLKISGGNTANTTPSSTSNTFYNQPSQYQQRQQPQSQYQQQRNNKGYNSHHQQHQQQTRFHNHHQHHSHHNHQQHTHHHQQQKQHHHSHQQSDINGANKVETIALDYLQTVIQCLNQNPGQFDTIATRFLTIFDGMENNQFVLSNAMENIFIESIQNPNFRYMGAKLYNLLHMLNLKKDSLFHELLKCKLEYHQNEVVQYMQSNQQQKVRETALFLAELYMQLRGDDSRIHLIAENILYSLEKLLTKESADNICCICLTLKLAGYDLTADCPEQMKKVIAQLDDINMKSPGKYPLAANVISLQKNNWGRKIQSAKSDPDLSKLHEPLRTSDEPIFYGPDGKELTAEEAEFLTGGIDSTTAVANGLTDDDDYPGDLDVDLDPEMDEETEKAYKEFCKLNTTS